MSLVSDVVGDPAGDLAVEPSGEQLGEVDPLVAAAVELVDLGPAGEAVGEDGGTRSGRTE